MSKFIAVGVINLDCNLADDSVYKIMQFHDIEITISRLEVKIEFKSDSVGNARIESQKYFESIAQWLSVILKIFVSISYSYLEDEKGGKHVVVTCDTLRVIAMQKDTFESAIQMLQNNLALVFSRSPWDNFALEYISLGNKLLRSSIPYRYRYAILEYARAVEITLGSWKKAECKRELEKQGLCNLISDIEWLLDLRGDSNIAHPPFSSRYATELDARKAQDIAINLVKQVMEFKA